MDDYKRIEIHRACHIPCIGTSATAAAAKVRPQHSDDNGSSRMTDGSKCRRNCMGTRRRAIESITNELEKEEEEIQMEECPCERITLELEDWSTCLIEDQRRSCGAGTRYRRRKCVVTSTGQLAPLRLKS